MKHGILLIMMAFASQASSAVDAVGIDRIAWLQGCWETVTPQRSIEEQWMAPRGKSMIGISRTVRNGNLATHEYVVVTEKGEQLAYEAHPANQPLAVFLSRSIDDTAVVFENLQHDFPQRIGYQRDGANGLLAFIEGMQKDKIKRIEFPYRRVACAGG